jgi:hypothetical protein
VCGIYIDGEWVGLLSWEFWLETSGSLNLSHRVMSGERSAAEEQLLREYNALELARQLAAAAAVADAAVAGAAGAGPEVLFLDVRRRRSRSRTPVAARPSALRMRSEAKAKSTGHGQPPRPKDLSPPPGYAVDPKHQKKE